MADSAGNSTTPRISNAPPRWARIARAIVIVAAVLILVGFFVAPPIAKNILEKQLSKNLSTPQVARTARIERVRINPLALSCAIEGLSITAPGREPLASWRNLYASLDLRTLFTRAWRFRQIALDGFSGRIAVLPDGAPGFADLLDPAAQRPPPAQAPRQPQGKPRPLYINKLTVTDAHLDYANASLPQPFATRLGPIDFTVSDFQTGGPGRAPGEFSATTESGETLSWRGNLAVAPLLSDGEIRIGNLSVKKYTPFYARLVRFDVLDGKIDIAIRYEISTQGGRLIARASQGGITLRDIRLAERGQTASAVTMETITLSGIAAEAGDTRSLRIEHIDIANGSLALRRDAHGISLAQLFTPAPSSAPAPAKTDPDTTPPAAPPPDISADQLTARNIAIAIEDATLGTPMRAHVNIDTLDAKKFSLSKLDTPLPLELTARIADGGTLRARGELALAPLRGKISAELSGAPLTLASAHISRFLNARIDAGLLAARADITIDPADGITATGDTNITGLAASDAAGNPLQSWKTLSLRGITFATQPAAKIAIDEIALDGAATEISISPDGKLNIASLARRTPPPPPANAPAPPQAGAPPEPRPLATIGKVTLTGNRVTFADNSIAPPVKISLDEINGIISGLSSENLAHADVDLRAKIDSAAPVSLTGQINPLSDDVYSDLRFTINNAALAPLGPYIGKYAGRSLAGGALNVDVTTKVSQRFLDSANVITLDQFELGERTGSPDATSLPIGLAMSLLRDRNGKIVLDVPVKGSLDDPDFKYGRAVWRAIGNLLVKAATAPFSLLTAVLGGAGNGQPAASSGAASDLSRAEFDPGANTPNETARKKLALLAKALRERPALQLAIVGEYDPGSDRAALCNLLLLAQLKQENATAPGDEPRLIERLYRRKFPNAEVAGSSAQKTPPPIEEMRARLLETIPVGEEQLRQLATARAEAVKNYLASEGVEARRIMLATPLANAALASLELR